MTRTALALALASIALTGCVARAGYGLGIGAPSSGAAAPAGEPPVAGYAPGEDAHWFQADDYFVAEKPYENAKLAVRVAKMTVAPTGQSKSEAHFLIANGKEMWTATFFRSRVAEEGDLRVGALAFCRAGYWVREGEPPKDKHDARQQEWVLAAITDTGDLYKGRVTVGDASCAIGAIRVPVTL